MKAAVICENLKKAISENEIKYGYVHSVFVNACNIEAGDALLTLLSRGREMAPMSVIVDNGVTVDFVKLGILKSARFEFSKERICCSELKISIDLAGAASWFPGIAADRTDGGEEDIAENIKTLEAGINSYSKHYITGPLVVLLGNELRGLEIPAICTQAPDKSIDFIGPRFLSFMKAVAEGDMDGASVKAGGIIGFGPGLTPSMDDFLCGVMLASVYMADHYKQDISKVCESNSRLIAGNLYRTTRISAEMLKHSATGETNEAARELIRAILARRDGEAVTKALIRTVAIGGTSGSDLALGIYAGFKITIAKSKNRGEFLNEALCRC